MDYAEYEKLKRDLIAAKEKALQKEIQGAEAKLYDELIEKLLTRLKGDQIANTSENISQLSVIDRVWESFVKNDMRPIIVNYVNGLNEIDKLNKEYFALFAETKKILDQIAEDAKENTRKRLGLTPSGRLTKGGYLDSLIRDETVKRQIKNLTYKAIVSDRITKEEYIASIRLYVKGNDKVSGALDRHFETFAYDTYAQHDREVSWSYAERLDMKYARYAGGLVEDSRPFCVARNNKVFTIEEILKFGTPQDPYGGYTNKSKGEFSGKPNEYDPVLDCGGYRCRHSYNFISKERALELRPDLE